MTSEWTGRPAPNPPRPPLPLPPLFPTSFPWPPRVTYIIAARCATLRLGPSLSAVARQRIATSALRLAPPSAARQRIATSTLYTPSCRPHRIPSARRAPRRASPIAPCAAGGRPPRRPHRTLRYRRAPHPTSPIARSLRDRRAPSTPILRRSVLQRRMFHVKHSYVEKQEADGPGARLRLPWPFLYASRPRVPRGTRGLLFLRRFGYC